ncbi:TRAP transporter substrate-binding protein [Brachybacterium sp. sponge]|uniref:TRAP transporter substrate-binding protein n=1 Tax=Brachybacterium sp. sponge TaxID=1775432 RepID=UPI0009EEC943|nr:TRAP transporter substrate-binding protein [Brachybacterium sp. sponge]
MPRISRRSLLSSVALGATAAALSGCARGTANPSPSVLRLGHAYGVGSLQNRASELFAEEVSARSNGEITVEIFPSGQLGSWEDMQESTETGAMHFVIESVGSLERYTDLAAIEGLPFLYDDEEHFLSVWDGDQGARMIQAIREDSGFLLLGDMYRGPRVLNSVHAVESLEDAAGLKLRVPTQQTYIDTWRMLGAAPTPLALTEVFSGIEQGAIDGQENPIDVVRFNSFFEVAPYVTNTNHIYGNFHLQTWGDTYDNWNDDTRAVVDEAVAEVSTWYRQTSIDETAENIKFLEGKGVEFFDIDAAGWREEILPLYDTADPTVQGWVEEIQGS